MSFFARHGAEPTALIEQLAAEIHDVYLETAKRLGWTVRPEVDVPYAQLSPEAKELDRAFARWHLQRTGRLR